LTVNDGVVSVVGDSSKKISYAEMIGGGYFHSQIGWNNQYGNPLALTRRQAQNIRSVQDRRHFAAAPRRRRQGVRHQPWVQDIRMTACCMPHDPPRRRGASWFRSTNPPLPDSRRARVRKGDFIGVVAPKEWDAVRASQRLKVNWSQVATRSRSGAAL